LGVKEIFDALGGGMLGLLAVTVFALGVLLLRAKDAQISDLKAENGDLKAERKEDRITLKNLTSAVERQSDVIEAWTPESQRRRLRS
jgi:hypothetical protein